MTCQRCADAPPWPQLRTVHTMCTNRKKWGLPIPDHLAVIERMYNHVVYHRHVGDRPVKEVEHESPDVLEGGEWVVKGNIRVWRATS